MEDTSTLQSYIKSSGLERLAKDYSVGHRRHVKYNELVGLKYLPGADFTKGIVRLSRGTHEAYSIAWFVFMSCCRCSRSSV